MPSHSLHIAISQQRWSKRLAMAAEERAWLTDAGSLTEKLVAHSQGHFAVELLAQQRRWTHPGQPNPTHHAQGLYWCRDVVLHGRGKPWVQATTLVPVHQRALIRRLQRLGRRPLGAFLFQQPNLRRLRMDYARLTHGLARRSWFTMGPHEIILIEVFLPDFFALPENHES